MKWSAWRAPEPRSFLIAERGVAEKEKTFNRKAWGSEKVSRPLIHRTASKTDSKGGALSCRRIEVEGEKLWIARGARSLVYPYCIENKVLLGKSFWG